MGLWDIVSRLWNKPNNELTLTGLPERYHILNKFERQGGLGEVFRAFDKKDGLEVVVKSYQVIDKYAEEYFLREINALQRLKPIMPSRYIVPIIDHFSDARLLVMPNIKGGDLARFIHEKSGLDEEITLVITSHVCRALQQMHQNGVVHRDIKPGNILLSHSSISETEIDSNDERYRKIMDDNRRLVTAMVTDFGLSYSGEVDRFEKSGTIIGTPIYMAPEVWRGSEPNPASDIYALGISIYQMLTNEYPYDGSTAEVTIAHLGKQIPDHDRIDDKMLEVIKRGCDKNPVNRPKPLEFVEDLHRAIYG